MFCLITDRVPRFVYLKFKSQTGTVRLFIKIMSLISCPECGKEICDKAKACPNCGCPIAEENSTTQIIQERNVESESTPFPELPVVLNVGKQIVNWGLNAALQNCYYVQDENYTHYIKEGKVTVAAHTNGISISGGLNFFYIHHAQIIDMKFIKHDNLSVQNKSVIGRAAVGGLILGPLGAVVGGMSGLGSKYKKLGAYLFIINFWDVYTHKIQSILLSSPIDAIGFIQKVESEKAKNNIPEGTNYVCNILDESGSISESKAIEALKVVGELKLAQQIGFIEHIGSASALVRIRKIGKTHSLDTKQFQSSGCSVAILIMISSGVALCSLLLMACS